MVKLKKYKKGVGAWISSTKGQRFFNFAYSIGAAVVIWGALFKILHLPGGNMLLSIGMGTEVLMFVLTAFDRPPREYNWEKVYPQLDREDQDEEAETPQPLASEEEAAAADSPAETPAAGVTGVTGVVYVGGQYQGGQPAAAVPAQPVAEAQQAPADVASATQAYIEQMAATTAQMQQLQQSTEALNKVSEILLESYRAITENSENITRSSQGYVQQMGDLSHNIQGLNTIYEIQLRSISSQLDSIDRVNQGIKDIRDMYEKSASQSSRYCEETEKMARYMQQLNAVYEKMITAMTINMYNPAAAAQAAATAAQTQQPAAPQQ